MKHVLLCLLLTFSAVAQVTSIPSAAAGGGSEATNPTNSGTGAAVLKTGTNVVGRTLVPGSGGGVDINEATDEVELEASSSVARITTGVGAPTGANTAGRDFYLDATNIRYYRGLGGTSWGEVARISSGSGAPAAGTCDAAAEVGGLYYRSDNTSGAGGHYGCAQTGSGTYGWVLLSGSGAVTASSTDTFTNKTLDAEGTGNSVTIPVKVWIPAAGCQNTTASLLWDTPTSNPAVAACVTGTNTQKGVADFADGANALSMQYTLALPSDWSGAIDAKFKWLSATTTGDVVWQIATSCVADAETDDPAFNTASTVTDTAKGTTNQTNDASIMGVTATGCAAGELLHIKVTRDPAHASDNHAATARLIGVELTLRRAM